MATINETLALDASVKQVSQDLNALALILQKSIRQQSTITESTQQYNEDLQKSSVSLEKLSDELTKEGKLTKEEIANRISLTKSLRDQIQRVKELNKQIAAARAAGNESKVLKLMENRQSAIGVLTKQREALAADKAGFGLSNLTKKLGPLAAIVTFITGLLVGQYQKTKEMITASAGFVEGASLFSAQWELNQIAMKRFAIDPTEMQKMLVGHRQVVHALGGTAATLDKLEPAIKEFRRFGYDAKEAFQAAIESMSMFRHLGIEATQHQMQSYTRDVAEGGKLFGMLEPEMRAYFDEVAKDVESIDLLKRARSSERAAILESQRAFIINARAAGMSAEQAKEAAKMLNKMVGAKPLDRLKQAARMQALAGAMGVSGGADAAAAVRAGSRATPEQRAQLASFSQNMATAADSMRGAGLGSELFAEALLQKLDPEGMFGRQSPFSMTLAEQLKIDREAVDKKMKDLKTDPLAIATLGIFDLLKRAEIAMQSGTGILAAANGIWEILKHPIKSILGIGPGSVTDAAVQEKQRYMKETGAGMSMGDRQKAVTAGELDAKLAGMRYDQWKNLQPPDPAIQKAEAAKREMAEANAKKRVEEEGKRAALVETRAAKMEEIMERNTKAAEATAKNTKELTEEEVKAVKESGAAFGGAATGRRGSQWNESMARQK